VVELKGESVEPERAGEHVFLQKGKPVNKHSIVHPFASACRRAEIPYGLKTTDGATFHKTRHTFGSWLAIRNVSIKTIQELLGHKDISMTMRYAHLAENVKNEAVNVLNGLTGKKNRNCQKSVQNAQMSNSTKIQQIEITVNI